MPSDERRSPSGGVIRKLVKFLPYCIVAAVVLAVVVDQFNATFDHGKAKDPTATSSKRRTGAAKKAAQKKKQARRTLESLGYLSAYPGKATQRGVTLHKKGKAYNGLNLINTGQGPWAVLSDMDGKVLHRWTYPIQRVWKKWNEPPPEAHGKVHHRFWRRVHLYPNGDLLAIFEGYGLIKIDKGSRLLWSYNIGRAHHDLDVLPDGRIVVLVRKQTTVRTKDKELLSLEDSIAVLSPSGQEQSRLAIREALKSSDQAKLLDELSYRVDSFLGDPFHTNTIGLLRRDFGAKVPAVKKGMLMVACRHLDLVGVVDLTTKRFVWTARGPWRRLHQPTITPDGTLLVFDNQVTEDYARVVEHDPATLKVLWEYRGDGTKKLASLILGSAQRLKNGNTLITESTAGRALEVTRDKVVVWEYRTGRAEKQYEDEPAAVHSLMEVIRIERDYSTWLSK